MTKASSDQLTSQAHRIFEAAFPGGLEELEREEELQRQRELEWYAARDEYEQQWDEGLRLEMEEMLEMLDRQEEVRQMWAAADVNGLEALERREEAMQIRAELLGFENADKEEEIHWMLAALNASEAAREIELEEVHQPLQVHASVIEIDSSGDHIPAIIMSQLFFL